VTYHFVTHPSIGVSQSATRSLTTLWIIGFEVCVTIENDRNEQILIDLGGGEGRIEPAPRFCLYYGNTYILKNMVYSL
jgi:hypothetical protein